jgi:hypothetical protein
MSKLPQRFIDRGLRNRLKEQEKIIQNRMPAMTEMAEAFRKIRDEKLYRLDYKNFNDYCRQVWGFGKDKTYGLIKQAEITSLGGSSTSENPTTTDNTGSTLAPGSETQTASSEEEVENEETPTSTPDEKSSGAACEEPSTQADHEEPLLDDTEKPVPARLTDIFKAAKQFLQVARILDRAAKLLGEIEVTRAYQIPDEEARKKGGERRSYSSFCTTAARILVARRPSIVCPACTGAYEPSPDSDICSRCGDKGFLTAEELPG